MYNLDNIFKLIKTTGMNQKELAKNLNVSPSVFSDWKTGRIKPTFEHLDKISDFFKVSIDFLLGKTDNPLDFSKTSDDDYQIQNDDEKRLIDMFRELNTEGQERVMIHAEDVVDSGKYIKNSADSAAV